MNRIDTAPRRKVHASGIQGTEQTPDARTERILGAIGAYMKGKTRQNRGKKALR